MLPASGALATRRCPPARAMFPEPRKAPGRDGLSFGSRLRALVARHRTLWLDTPIAPPELEPTFDRSQQRRGEAATRRLVADFQRDLRRPPGGQAERLALEARLREAVSRFGEEHLGWSPSYRRLLLSDGITATTADFAREARAVDPEMGEEDLFQALRNVWIANSIQMLLDQEVRLTPGVFAYSMLYPLTDNFLDDPEVSPAAKRALNRRLGRRLAGRPGAARDRRERDVFAMVERIEGEFPREGYPGVYRSLLAIHRGQVQSLRQQGGLPPAPGVDLLAVAVEKGGTSVLTDGYLVAGELSPRLAEFLFGYGVFLQHLDDLQDARRDRDARHATLFSVAVDSGEPLDGLTGRLYRYMHRVLDAHAGFTAPRGAAVRELIARNCTLLMVGAVGENRELFTRGFARRMEAASPVSFAAYPRLRRRVRRAHRKVRRSLARRGFRGSLLGLLEEARLPRAAGDAPAVSSGDPRSR